MYGLSQPEKKISIHLFCMKLINAVAIQECLYLRRDQVTTGDQVPLRTVKRVENGVRVLERIRISNKGGGHDNRC